MECRRPVRTLPVTDTVRQPDERKRKMSDTTSVKADQVTGNTKDFLEPEEILELREQYIFPSVMVYYSEPVHIVKGEMTHVYDHTGKKYLDGFGAVVTISCGHCHPDVTRETAAQLGKLQHITSLYLTEPLVRAAERLAGIAPGNLRKSFFTNSGTEATEFSAMVAKNYTKNPEFIALRHSFHGRTIMSMTLTGQSLWRHSLPYVFGVSHAPAPYCYRCPWKTTYPECGAECACDVEEIIRHSTSGKIAAFIAEPIQGFGGVIEPPPEYFGIVHEIVKRYGGLFIADEVQTGFGRTGDKWFGIEHWGVDPDIITMAKGMGNGIPAGGVITTPEIAEAMRGIIHFSTYGGNPVTCTQVKAVIDTIDRHEYHKNATVVGGYLKNALLELAEKHELIGDVRGRGLMLGVELVKDRKTKEPAAEELLKIMELAKDRGLLLGKGGMAGNVIRIKPPLCITMEEAETLIGILDESLTAFRGG